MEQFMKKKGFTLIELLAVIVVLAIIALIATPVVLGAIGDARDGAIKSSTFGYINGVEHNLATQVVDDQDTIVQGTYDIADFPDVSKGTKPSNGTIVVGQNGVVTEAELCIYDVLVNYNNGVVVIDKETDCNINTNGFAFYDHNFKAFDDENQFQVLITAKGKVYMNPNPVDGNWTQVDFSDENVAIKKVYSFTYENIFALGTNDKLYKISYDTLYGNEYLEDVDSVYTIEGRVAVPSTIFFLMNDGTVMSEGYSRNIGVGMSLVFGGNRYYEHPNLIGYNTSNYNSPLTTIPGLTNVKKIVADPSTVYAILNDGTVMVWGNNLGGAEYDYINPSASAVGSTPIVSDKYANTPKLIPGLTDVKDIYTEVSASYGGSGSTQYVAAYPVTYSIHNDGTVRVWGTNKYNLLGLGLTEVSNDEYFQETPILNTYMQGAEKFYFPKRSNNELDGTRTSYAYFIKSNGQLFQWGESFTNSTIPSLATDVLVKNLVLDDYDYLDHIVTNDDTLLVSSNYEGSSGGGFGPGIDYDRANQYLINKGYSVPPHYFTTTPIDPRMDEMVEDTWNMIYMFEGTQEPTSPEEWDTLYEDFYLFMNSEYGIDEDYCDEINMAIDRYISDLSRTDFVSFEDIIVYIGENGMDFPSEYDHYETAGQCIFTAMTSFEPGSPEGDAAFGNCIVVHGLTNEEVNLINGLIGDYINEITPILAAASKPPASTESLTTYNDEFKSNSDFENIDVKISKYGYISGVGLSIGRSSIFIITEDNFFKGGSIPLTQDPEVLNNYY